MSATRIMIRTTPRGPSRTELARGVATLILVATVLGVLFAGLFPFDFTLPRGMSLVEKVRRDFDRSPEPPVLEDRVVNVIFFVPIGFAIAAFLSTRSRFRLASTPPAARRAALITAALVAGAILSGVVEVGQVFLGYRDPTWSDVFMNTLGAVVGAIAYLLVGGRILDFAATQLGRLWRFFTPTFITVATLLYSVGIILLPLLFGERGSLENWDTSYPLMLGNEISQDREWNGSVGSVTLASRAISSDEVKELDSNVAAIRDAIVGSYSLIGKGPFVDRSKTLPNLEWVGGPPEEQGEKQPAHVSKEHWLKTPTSAAIASRRIRDSGQFTVAVACATDDIHKDGPGRIVSISLGTAVRNLTIGQEGENLAIRIRTPTTHDEATAPQVEVGGVFSDTSEHRIVVTYANTRLVAYVDGVEQGRMEITPEAAAIWSLYPRNMWRIRIDQSGFRSYAAVYRLLVFIPLGALVGASVRQARLDRARQLLIVAGAVIITAFLHELVIGRMTVSGFQMRDLITSLAIEAATALSIVLRRKATSASARFD
jgi:hypothetical protein